MRRFKGSWRRLALVAAALLVGASALTAGGDTRVQAQGDVFVYAGAGQGGIAVELFLPSSVAVNRGGTVEFINPFEEPHTVTFGHPDAAEDEPFNVAAAAAFDGSEEFNSGILWKDDHFSITFEELGVYTFLCLLHPGMEIDVTVVPEGQFIPPQGANSPAVINTIEEGIAVGQAASADALAEVNAINATATDTWAVKTGPSVPFRGATVDVMGFLPQEINIGVGDTVVWENETFLPHMVTFFNAPPPEDFNPFVPVLPASSVFNPAAFYNAVISMNPAFGGVSDFSLTFDTPGSFAYVCVIHAELGMAGVVNVGAASIRPPATGDAGMAGGSSTGTWMMLAGTAMLLAGLAAGTVVVARRDA